MKQSFSTSLRQFFWLMSHYRSCLPMSGRFWVYWQLCLKPSYADGCQVGCNTELHPAAWTSPKNQTCGLSKLYSNGFGCNRIGLRKRRATKVTWVLVCSVNRLQTQAVMMNSVLNLSRVRNCKWSFPSPVFHIYGNLVCGDGPLYFRGRNCTIEVKCRQF